MLINDNILFSMNESTFRSLAAFFFLFLQFLSRKIKKRKEMKRGPSKEKGPFLCFEVKIDGVMSISKESLSNQISMLTLIYHTGTQNDFRICEH